MSLPTTETELINDLYERTHEAIRLLAKQIRETGEPLEHNSIVDTVQAGLPADYPIVLARKMNSSIRRLIKDVAGDIIERLLAQGALT